MFNLKSILTRSKPLIAGLALATTLAISLNVTGNVGKTTKVHAASLMDNSVCVSLFQDYTAWGQPTRGVNRYISFNMTDTSDRVAYTEGTLYLSNIPNPTMEGYGTQLVNINRYSGNDSPFDPTKTTGIDISFYPNNGQVLLYNYTTHQVGSLGNSTCQGGLIYSTMTWTSDNSTHMVVIKTKKEAQYFPQ